MWSKTLAWMRLIGDLFVMLERNSLGAYTRLRVTWAIFWKILTMSSCLGDVTVSPGYGTSAILHCLQNYIHS